MCTVWVYIFWFGEIGVETHGLQCGTPFWMAGTEVHACLDVVAFATTSCLLAERGHQLVLITGVLVTVACARMCRHAAACGAAAREGAGEGGRQLVHPHVPAHSFARLAHCTAHRYYPGWSLPCIVSLCMALLEICRSCTCAQRCSPFLEVGQGLQPQAFFNPRHWFHRS